MLSRPSLELARLLAVSTESLKISNPNPTLFDDAIRYSLPLVRKQGQQVSLENFVEEVAVTADVTSEDGFAQHEAAVADATEILLQGLITQMRYVRNTVLPVISQVSSDVLERVKDTEPRDLEVVQYEPSPLVKSGLVREIVSKFKVKQELTKLVRNAPEREENRLIGGMHTGIPELDDALAASIAKYGTGVVTKLYNAVFRGEYDRAPTPMNDEIYRLLQKTPNGSFTLMPFTQEHADLGIILYFLVDSLVTDPLEGTGLGLAEYENAMGALRNQVGLIAHMALRQYDDAINAGKLVIRRPRAGTFQFKDGDGQVVVFAEVYRKFLDQGGSPEALIGGATTEKPVMYLSEYLQNKDHFVALWKKLTDTREAFSRKTILTRIGEGLVQCADERIRALPEDQFPADVNRVEKVAEMRAALKDLGVFFRGWDVQDTPNVYELVKEKMCAHVFNFVDAKGIIDTINEELEDGEVHPAHAAWYAAMRYLAKWSAANFTITQ
jgi:hypothetical protein